MADGDTFDQHGRQWWKTTARKLFTGDPTFEQSAIWSVDKTIRDGGLTGFRDTVDLLYQVVKLQRLGIDSRMLADVRLREIAGANPDQASGVAIGIARSLLVDQGFILAVNRLSGNEQRGFVGQQLLARVVVENASTPDLLAALLNESTRDRLNLTQIEKHQSRAIQLLSQSEEFLATAILTGRGEGPIENLPISGNPTPAKTRRPRVDHRKQAYDPAMLAD